VQDTADVDTYFVPAVFEPWSRELIKRALVWKGDRVLDVATGTGIVACRIAAIGAKVTAIDISAERLEQAKRRAADEGVSVTWAERNAETLGYGAASFDLVTCQQGLQFVADRAAAAREMRRVIAPGGRAVIACWCAVEQQPVYQLVDAIATRHLGRGARDPFAFGDAAALKKLLDTARFFAVAVETVTRKVRFPDPGRFVELTVNSIARDAGVDDAAKIAAATGELTDAVAPFVVDGSLEMSTASLIAVGRVPTK
jgi:ubiquinone/menaquinone biosynthesis C-methylase UbiE